METVTAEYERNIFINCPFDKSYLKLLRPLLFTTLRFGFYPKIASETSDSLELRLQKICRLIRESRYSIHDLSRLQAKKPGEFYRMNMPFELGIEYGCRLFSENHLQAKRCLILAERRFEYMKGLSDLAGIDLKAHQGEPAGLIRRVRNWFVETVGLRQVPSSTVLWHDFNAFMVSFYDERRKEGYTDEDLEGMPVVEFTEFIQEWVQEHDQ